MLGFLYTILISSSEKPPSGPIIKEIFFEKFFLNNLINEYHLWTHYKK